MKTIYAQKHVKDMIETNKETIMNPSSSSSDADDI